jgi:hypothetical protein
VEKDARDNVFFMLKKFYFFTRPICSKKASIVAKINHLRRIGRFRVEQLSRQRLGADLGIF